MQNFKQITNSSQLELGDEHNFGWQKMPYLHFRAWFQVFLSIFYQVIVGITCRAFFSGSSGEKITWICKLFEKLHSLQVFLIFSLFGFSRRIPVGCQYIDLGLSWGFFYFTFKNCHVLVHFLCQYQCLALQVFFFPFHAVFSAKLQNFPTGMNTSRSRSSLCEKKSQNLRLNSHKLSEMRSFAIIRSRNPMTFIFSNRYYSYFPYKSCSNHLILRRIRHVFPLCEKNFEKMSKLTDFDQKKDFHFTKRLTKRLEDLDFRFR